MRLFVAASFLIFRAPLFAHDIITTNLTFARDISRIFDKHCVSCHGPGSNIPLNTYADARPWAVAIKEQVLSRAMPPWGAIKGFGNLTPDHGMTQEEILIVAAWVIGGAPQGDPLLLPRQAKGKPAVPPPALKDALTVSNQAKLHHALRVLAVRPLPDAVIDSARITAHLPDGRIVPLLWLYKYDPKWKRDFLFRNPVQLPVGTVLESTAPLRFVLETVN